MNNDRTICVIQHAPCEGLGTIEEALKSEGLVIEAVKTFERQPVPKAPDSFRGLIVMGGPMSVYEQERYPNLREEMGLIENTLKQAKPVLGVCLGSQMLASVLGSPVTKGKEPEIGWHAVALNDSAARDALWAGVPRSFHAFHWHGDMFDLPAGTIPLASSELTECQAFRYGSSAYGVLFHVEVTRSILEGMLSTFAQELKAAGLTAEQILGPAKDYLPNLHHIGATVFQRWARMVRNYK